MKKIIGISFVVFAVVFTSCNNDKVEEPLLQDEEIIEKSAQITVAEVQVEAATTESTYEVEFFANAEETLTRWWRIGKRFEWNNQLRYLRSCPEVTIKHRGSSEYPKQITLDYGEGTELKNGKVLSGTIVIEISAPRRSRDYTRTVSYNDFGIDSLLVNGTSKVEVDKVDEMFRKYTSALSFVLADGTEITRESERVWQWIAGMDTEANQTDDLMIIAGKAEASMGEDTYEKEITTPLKRIGGCRHIVEGIVEISLNGELISTLDYGDGTCDAIAIMTNANGTKEIDLAKRHAGGKQERKRKGKE